MGKKNTKTAEDYRGELMLQITAGRYFRTGVEVGERIHRRTVYSNATLWDYEEIDLPPIGRLISSSADDDVFGHLIEVVDRLERKTLEGVDEFHVGTGGEELIDDLAYVLSFALNRTFSQDQHVVRKLVPQYGSTGRQRKAAALFPYLFEPRTLLHSSDFEKAQVFITKLLELSRDDFSRIMRAIRGSVDATRRAIDDPTGAYTDLVATLESLIDVTLTTPTTWDMFDSTKRKIYDAALDGETPELIEKVQQALLEADHAGLARQFVSSTIARIGPDYYRAEAATVLRPPRSADIERMLGIAYRIRSKRTHILEDLGEEAWGFSDGAEVSYDPKFEHVLTLAGLWRLTRHVLANYIDAAAKVDPEPWDYRMSLPGIRFGRLAPQLWLWHDLPGGHKPADAFLRLEGMLDALIAWRSDPSDGFSLENVPNQIQNLVPGLSDGEHKTALIGIHRLWHEWTDPNEHSQEQRVFTARYESHLAEPSPIAFAVQLLARDFKTREWSPQEWADLATTRRGSRLKGKGVLLPAKVDAYLQVIAADQMNDAGRREEALRFASQAVEECPGNERLLTLEAQLIAGNPGLKFDVDAFLFERPNSPGEGAVPEPVADTAIDPEGPGVPAERE